MVYIDYLDETYDSVQHFLECEIEGIEDFDYVIPELEDKIAEVFPDINIDNLALDFTYWEEREGPYRIGMNYNFELDETEFKEKYPEYYI